jgi:glycosyltransferase involved in cell wall biosynthesis
MIDTRRDFVVAVQAPAYPVSESEFATESAFAEHLRELQRSMSDTFDRLVLIAPCIPEERYRATKGHLGVVSVDRDHVLFVPAHEVNVSGARFWTRDAVPISRRVWRAVGRASVVQAGMADDLPRPLMAIVNAIALIRRVPLIFVVDIDFRQYAQMFHRLGIWGLRSYLINRYVYDPIKWSQVWLAVRLAALTLLKSPAMVRDFGRGRDQVKSVYDTVHAPGDVLSDGASARRAERIAIRNGALKVVYFGRFVQYKGLDKAIRAVAFSRAAGCDVTLTLIGSGEQEQELRTLAETLDVVRYIDFRQPLPYGPGLFEILDEFDVTVACPLVEDTPRAAFDSLARGLPIVAFDLPYFAELAKVSGAVTLAKWPDEQDMCRIFCALQKDRRQLENQVRSGVVFALENVQSVWLTRRADWVRALVQRD